MASTLVSANYSISFLFFILLAGYAASAVNWDNPANKTSPFFPYVATSTSGPEMYAAYCASCHGKDGRAKTPAARLCTVPPADLSTLALKNHGIYPAARVSEVLHNGTGKPATGQGYMPVWQPLLQSMNSETLEVTELRIRNLTDYVKTLQVPLPPPRPRPPVPI
jgi:mono/diheme cytochrome c family protein